MLLFVLQFSVNSASIMKYKTSLAKLRFSYLIKAHPHFDLMVDGFSGRRSGYYLIDFHDTPKNDYHRQPLLLMKCD